MVSNNIKKYNFSIQMIEYGNLIIVETINQRNRERPENLNYDACQQKNQLETTLLAPQETTLQLDWWRKMEAAISLL